MKCVVCKNGTTKPGKTPITLEKDGSTLVFKSVPARLDRELSRIITTPRAAC